LVANADGKPQDQLQVSADAASSKKEAVFVDPPGRGKPRLVILGSGWAAVSLVWLPSLSNMRLPLTPV